MRYFSVGLHSGGWWQRNILRCDPVTLFRCIVMSKNAFPWYIYIYNICALDLPIYQYLEITLISWFLVLGEYYCHRPRPDSCRRDFNIVPLICRLWNALSTSGGSVHVYRFSTIFATDRVWFGCMLMYCSWKRQLLLCESCFAKALELPLKWVFVPEFAQL